MPVRWLHLGATDPARRSAWVRGLLRGVVLVLAAEPARDRDATDRMDLQ